MPRTVPVLMAMLAVWSPAEGSEVEAVERRMAALIDSDNRSDLEGVIDSYTDDAVLIPPGEEKVVGRAAIERRYRGIFETSRFELTLEPAETAVSAGWAFSRGLAIGRLVPLGGGEPRVIKTNYMMLFRRGEGGDWKISHLIWNEAAPQ